MGEANNAPTNQKPDMKTSLGGSNHSHERLIQTHRFADKYSALREASIIQADGADSVIIMGTTNDTLKYLVDNHVSVSGHVGVLSGWQTGKFGGYKRVGRTADDTMEIFRQAYEYQENGMCGMTIENTPREVTNAIAKKLRVPVVGVAAGGCDADSSELVHFDLVGMMPQETGLLGRCVWR